METAIFKKIFSEIAKQSGFEKAYEGWFKEYSEVIFVLDLQKSNFSELYYLNIKLYIQGCFGNIYVKSKNLVKVSVGNISVRQPSNYSNLLDLEFFLEEGDRRIGLKKFFEDFIIPFTEKTNSKERIKKFYKEGGLFILPAVRRELGIIDL